MTVAPRELGSPKAAERVLPGEPGRHADTLRQLAAFQMSHGAMQLADRLTRIALWLDPSNPENWRIRANCLSRLDNPREAFKLLSQARTQGISGIGLRDLLVVGFAFARTGYLTEAKKLLMIEKRD